MAPGDTVLVHSGTYGGWGACRPSNPSACPKDPEAGQLLALVGIERSGGDATHRFTIKAAPGEHPVLDGLLVPSEPLDAAFHVVNSDFVTIQGFTMRNFSAMSWFCSSCGIENYGTIVWDKDSDDGEVLDNVITGSDPAGTACCYEADINFGPTAKRLMVHGNSIVTTLPLGISMHGTAPPPPSEQFEGEISGNHIIQTFDSGNTYFLRAIYVNKVNGIRVWGNYMEDLGIRDSNSCGLFFRDGNSHDIRGNVVRGYGTGVVIQDSVAQAGPRNFNDEEKLLIANNVLDAVDPSGTEAAINSRNGDAGSCDGCVMRNNIILNYARGFEISQVSGDPWPSATTLGNNILHNVAVATDGSSFPGDTVVEPNNEFDAPDPLVGVPPLPTPASWTARTLGALTPSTPYYQIMPGSLAENFGDSSVCPWTPADGRCDAGAYELSGGGASTCADLGGTPCASGEICDGGDFMLSSDAGNLCCVGGTCTPAPACVDADGDGYGDMCAAGPDCDDTNAAVHPGAAEICNGIDDNCDGRVDEGLASLVSCGTGICQKTILQWCEAGAMGPTCQPNLGGAEICNGIDDDCDGLTDEGGVCGSIAETHVLEAENGFLSGAVERISDPGARFRLAIRSYSTAGSLPCSTASTDSVHIVRIAQAGDYRIWVRIKGTDYPNDAFCVGVDSGSRDRVFPDALNVYEWVPVETFQSSGDYLHHLEAGSHRIDVGRGEVLALIDAVCVTNQVEDGSQPCDAAGSEVAQPR
ncbi:MAG TPA: MopE-related protein [Candidatus Saccharimonadales bacterium]|nr:MopE-related protein [Candidatus Saccharimonadales bacterium]